MFCVLGKYNKRSPLYKSINSIYYTTLEEIKNKSFAITKSYENLRIKDIYSFRNKIFLFSYHIGITLEYFADWIKSTNIEILTYKMIKKEIW